MPEAERHIEIILDAKEKETCLHNVMTAAQIAHLAKDKSIAQDPGAVDDWFEAVENKLAQMNTLFSDLCGYPAQLYAILDYDPTGE